MPELIINGAKKLCGKIQMHGAKNSTLPLMAASLICSGECVLHNCPGFGGEGASPLPCPSLGGEELQRSTCPGASPAEKTGLVYPATTTAGRSFSSLSHEATPHTGFVQKRVNLAVQSTATMTSVDLTTA